MMAILMLIVMVFSTFAPIAQQAGIEAPFGAITAYAESDSNGNDSSTTGGGLDDITITEDGKVSFGNSNVDTNKMLKEGKGIVTIILSVCCLVCLAFLIINITKFAKSGDNENERRKAIGGMLTTGIGVALLGSVTFWYSFFYTAINTTT